MPRAFGALSCVFMAKQHHDLNQSEQSLDLSRPMRVDHSDSLESAVYCLTKFQRGQRIPVLCSAGWINKVDSRRVSGLENIVET